VAHRKVLYVSHNHPRVRPGGAEEYALELYQGMRSSEEFEPILLARIGPPMARTVEPHEGTPFRSVDGEDHQYFLYTDNGDFDWFYGTLRDKSLYTRHFREFLLAHRPDVVHFQHTVFLGYDLVRETRNTLPDAAIVYTLQEMLPICHRQGLMLRTQNHELCHESSPRRCHECFPEISPQAFFRRKRFIQSHLSLVDLFLAPSHFLLERYVDWGIPRSKIRFEDYGRHAVHRRAESDERRARNRIGFFGQFSRHKGVHTLLEAMRILAREAPDVRLRLHGANLGLQPKAFQTEFDSLLEATKSNVTLVGRYEHAELPQLMAAIDWVVVPSIWWENSPLVIQEAFQHGRPVICSDIGGMAEKVTHGVTGLHFRIGDPTGLAATIREAVSSPGLWEQLSGAIPGVYRMEDHAAAVGAIYRALLDGVPSSEGNVRAV
jgi:glycosyltransferase involved in cell wall biosynthesis